MDEIQFENIGKLVEEIGDTELEEDLISSIDSSPEICKIIKWFDSEIEFYKRDYDIAELFYFIKGLLHFYKYKLKDPNIDNYHKDMFYNFDKYHEINKIKFMGINKENYKKYCKIQKTEEL